MRLDDNKLWHSSGFVPRVFVGAVDGLQNLKVLRGDDERKVRVNGVAFEMIGERSVDEFVENGSVIDSRIVLNLVESERCQ
jgi:hypothetical protein